MRKSRFLQEKLESQKKKLEFQNFLYEKNKEIREKNKLRFTKPSPQREFVNLPWGLDQQKVEKYLKTIVFKFI